MANDALADSPRQCGPFQLAETTSAEMAYNPSIGYVRPKVSERVRRSAGDRGLARAQRFAEDDISFFILPDLTDQDLEKIGIAYERHTSRDPIFAAIAEHQKVAAALMVALKHKWRLEDKLGGKAYDGDDPKWIAGKS